MNEIVMREKIHQAVDQHCAHLQDNPWLAQQVLQAANSKSAMMRKSKFSVALVVAFIVMLLSATAVAATVLYRFYSQNIATEAEYGFYQDWPLNEKIALVDRMVEENLINDTSQADKLHDATLMNKERETIADEIVTGYYGEGHDGVLSAANIMEHDMGQFNTWSLEDQAWFSQQQFNSSHEQVSYEFHKIPGDDDMPVDKAITLARDLLTEVFDIDRQELETWETIVSFSTEQISDGVNPTHMEDIYSIGFYEPGNDVHPYWVQLSHDGFLMHMEMAYPDNNINDYLLSLLDEFDTPEQKAKFAKKYAPMIQQLSSEGYDVHDVYLWLASIDYVMPNAEYISENSAGEIAEAASIALDGWSLERLNTYYYKPVVSLRRISDNTVVWFFKYRLRAKYFDSGFTNEIPWGVKVSIDAKSGDVLSTEEYYFDSPYCVEKE